MWGTDPGPGEWTRVLTNGREPIKQALQDANTPVEGGDADSEGEPDASDSTEETDATSLIAIVAGRLDGVVSRLGDSGMTEGMAAATTLALDSGQVPVQQAVFKHLAAQAPIQDRDLIEALLNVAPRYVSSGWPNQLGHLDIPALSKLPVADKRLGQLGALLWMRSMDSEESRDSDERRAEGLAALKKLLDGGAPIDQQVVAEAVGNNLSGPFLTNADVDAQSRMLAIGEEFAATGLLDRQALADADLACCAQTLASDRNPDQPETERVPQAVYTRVVDASPHASISALDGVLEAISPSPWLSEPLKAALPVLLTAARRRLDPDTQPPFGPQQLAELRARDGETFDSALAAWITAFRPPPEDIWGALGDLATGPLPDAIAQALRQHARELSAKEKFDLARPAVEDSSRAVGSTFLRAIQFPEADQAQAASAIIRVVDGDEVSAQQWVTALNLWGELKPTGQPTQERLIQSVYLPAVRSGREGVDVAISHFGLVSHQRAKIRSEIIDALSKAAADDDQSQRIEDRLKDAGWLKRGGLLGRGPVKKTDDDAQ